MKAVILAGGKGSRLHPLTLEIPKPLITIRKRPLINYNLALFGKYGISEVKVIIRPEDAKDYERWYREYAGEFSKMKIDLVSEPEPMGTLGYLFHELRGWMGDEAIFVTNGDDIKDIDLAAMTAFHRKEGAPVTLALMRMEKPDDYDAAVVKGDRIKTFLQKQPGLPPSLVSAGMYLVSPAAFDTVGEDVARNPEKFLMFEKDMFPALAKADKLGAFVSEGTFYDCGTFDRWEKAIREA